MPKLLAVGDSFTYGDELEDRFSSAWPYLLGKKLGYEVNNLGVRASGNYKMVRSIIAQDISEFDLVIVGWSGFDRIEIADEVGIYDTWPGGERKPPRAEAEWRKSLVDYISRHHDDEYLYRQYLTYIILAQTYLKFHKKKYIMLDAFINHEFPGRFDVKNLDLLSKIDTENFIGWPNESMKEWTKHVPKGPGFHFLEEGHQIVADKILNHIDLYNLNIVK